MTLKEKFDKVMAYPFSEYKEQMKVLKEENSNEYLKIADEFAIGFAEWLNGLDINEYVLQKHISSQELLEIYKKDKGL